VSLTKNPSPSKKTIHQQEQQEVAASRRGFFAEMAGLSKLWPYLRSQKKLIIAAALMVPVISALQTALPLILKYSIDHGILENDSQALFWSAVLFFVVVLAEYAVRASQSVLSSLAVHRMIKSLRSKLVRHVLRLKCSFHDKTLSGSLVTRATSDFDNLSESLNMGVLTSVVDLAVLAGCIIGMFVLDWHLAIWAVLVVPFVGMIVQWFSKGLKTTMMKARVKIAALNAYTQECLYGHATIKTLVAEKDAGKKYDQLNIEYRDAQMGSVVLDALMFAVLDGIASITIGVVLWLIVKEFWADATASAISVGVIIAFVQYIQQLFEPMKHLGNKMAMLQGAFTSIDRIFTILGKDDFVSGNGDIGKVEGRLSFKKVSFSYSANHASPVLHDVSFNINPGESLAIVGATGSGKSTIIKLVSRLYDGYEGSIALDGHEISYLDPHKVRQHIAIVPQDIVLFDGTLAFNISLNHPGITREQIIHVCQKLGADRFIDRLPDTYDFKIKEQGANLSHGQRQVLAFARAMVRNPELIILDEATSSVDPGSEEIIQQATNTMLAEKTVIVIAHRLSTIRRCTNIMVLDKGRIVEEGSHAELVAKQGAYFGLSTAFA
jgi:ATP-binding cassette subfamily B multidrug efflux pump